MQPKNKNTFRTYFTFNARERRAVILLLLLVIFFFIAPHIIPNIVEHKAGDQKQGQQTVTDTLVFKRHFAKDNEYNQSIKEISQESEILLYPFDPNTLSADQWEAFGVREKTVLTIIRYRQKGGRFSKPEDLRKIWGLSNQLAEKLIPYVRIQPGEKHPKEFSHSAKTKSKQVDINEATQEEWESLPGIGPGLASRIMKFREKLGGFLSIDQVGQTYGLPDSTFLHIKARLHKGVTPLRLLNINQLSTEDLSKHPYINYKTAKAIVQYRAQHGNYHSVQDLQKLESVSPEVYHQMEPYISTE